MNVVLFYQTPVKYMVLIHVKSQQSIVSMYYLQGATEQQQLNLISQLCGSINPESFPGVDRLELYNKLELIKGQKRRVKERLKVNISEL